VSGPVKCIDVVFPYDNSGQARNSNLFYDTRDGLWVAALRLRNVNLLANSPGAR
jgi:hypothetical protein